jgi:hypothetical protein
VLAPGWVLAGLLVILVVDCAKSSVFWNFKVGTEALPEDLLYLSPVSVLSTNRDRANLSKYLVLALITVFATFVRPDSLPMMGVLVLFPLFRFYVGLTNHHALETHPTKAPYSHRRSESRRTFIRKGV